MSESHMLTEPKPLHDVIIKRCLRAGISYTCYNVLEETFKRYLTQSEILPLVHYHVQE